MKHFERRRARRMIAAKWSARDITMIVGTVRVFINWVTELSFSAGCEKLSQFLIVIILRR